LFTRIPEHVQRRLVLDNKSIYPEEILNNQKDDSFFGFLRDVRAQGRMYAMPTRDERASLSIPICIL
jgi:hypothetical protein